MTPEEESYIRLKYGLTMVELLVYDGICVNTASLTSNIRIALSNEFPSTNSIYCGFFSDEGIHEYFYLVQIPQGQKEQIYRRILRVVYDNDE